jgi:Flp pilus assembly protein TadD
MKTLLSFPLFALAIFFLMPLAAIAQTPASLDEARAALKANDLAKAAALLEPLTGADAKDAAAFSALSQVRLAQKNLPEAVTLAEKATTLDATNAAYFSQLGLAISRRMADLPMMQQATMAVKLRKAFAKAVELDPNDLTGLIGLCRFYANAPEIAGGSIEKAREFAARVQKIDPFLGELELGNVADRDENFAEALTHFEAATKLKPNAANVHALAGRMLAKLGRKDEARARFESALKIQPTLEAAKQGLAALGQPAP